MTTFRLLRGELTAADALTPANLQATLNNEDLIPPSSRFDLRRSVHGFGNHIQVLAEDLSPEASGNTIQVSVFALWENESSGEAQHSAADTWFLVQSLALPSFGYVLFEDIPAARIVIAVSNVSGGTWNLHAAVSDNSL